MNNHLRRLTRHYTATLRKYAADEQEATLEEAYELGRRAIARGLGVLDMARIHQQALDTLRRALTAENQSRMSNAAGTFFLEALSPFEVTHRGFSETNVKLQQAIATLESRNRELAEFNRNLEVEIGERLRAEQALHDSELKFRSVVESARDGLVIADQAGRIIFLNRSVEAIFGYSQAEVLGKSWALFSPEANRAKYRKCMKQAVSARRFAVAGLTVEGIGRRKAGAVFPLELSFSAWKTVAGKFYTGIVRDITERKRVQEALRQSEAHFRELFHDACRMQEALRNLSNKVLRVQEEERKRISRELHDEIGQSLTAISVALATLKNNGDGHGDVSRRKLADTQHLLCGTMDTVHRFARELRPAMLDELGLLPALRSCLKAFAERTGLHVHFHADPIAEQLGGDEKITLFRVAQESLTNVAKHARASRVDCCIRKLRDGVGMEIEDNGRSFRENAQHAGSARKRLGLLGMQERVRLVNGRFTIKPRFGKGTTVKVVIPFRSSGPVSLSKYGQNQNNGERHSVDRSETVRQ